MTFSRWNQERSSKTMQWSRKPREVTSCGKKTATTITEKHFAPRAMGAKVVKRQKNWTRRPRVLFYYIMMTV
ncbi:uncharacterized protein H6S33_008355 [Morchella sextelata]|uniref:uncharacterized protein n=1 Tax=Morchella sextelata TaxID=1174677 RepID=UPI001D059727|nr:uncharacterized protein H6S33_008355 [Morchella sextelata]KAH0602705.1 hypothetical protein H6S33_008355 [Morchella sextelata]